MPQYNHGYTAKMKTAISVPDKVFDAAEKAAKKLGMSRSEFYTTAVKEFMEQHRALGVTERLNAVYADEDSELSEDMKAVQRKTLERSEW